MNDPQKNNETEKISNIKVKVHLSDFLTRTVPNSRFEIDVQTGSVLLEIINLISEYLGQEFQHAIFDQSGRLHEGILLVLNRRPVPTKLISDIALSKDSDLSIIPLANGG